MSFKDCINKALEAKKIKGKNRDKAIERYESFVDEYVANGMDAAAAEVKAAEDATRFFEIEQQQAKIRRMAHLRKRQEHLARYGESGFDTFGQYLQGAVDYDPRYQGINYATIKERVRGQLGATINSMIEKYKPHEVVGVLSQNKLGLDNLVRIIKGANIADGELQAMAKAWRDMTKLATERFRMAGGSMLDLESWDLPQQQSPAMLRGRRDEWVNDWLEWGDWSKIRRSDGSRLLTVEQRKAFLDKAFENLVSDGRASLSPGAAGQRAMGNKLDQHRVLHLKDGDAWLAMHEKYGEGGIYDVFVNHLDYMAQQIAMLETFGPNPRAMRDDFRNISAREAGQAEVAATSRDRMKLDDWETEFRKFDTLFSIINLETATPEYNRLGAGLANLRHALSAAYLSKAVLSAVPGDLMSMHHVATFNKMHGMKLMQRYLKLMNPANATDRRIAGRIGFINENAAAIAYGGHRFMEVQDQVPGWGRFLSDTIFRSTLMSPHTQMARWAWHIESLGMLTDLAADNAAFSDITFRSVLEKYGITEADWEWYKSIPEREVEGAVFRHPDDGGDVRRADKFMGMIVMEGRRAVPDSTLQAQAMFKGKTEGGTFAGELLRSTAMFKNFPMSVYFLHGRDAMARQGFASKASYIGSFLGLMTVAGMIGLQARELANGRDPLALVDTENAARTMQVWGKAFLQGGGLGIFGDFILADRNRFGGGLSDTLAGPMVQFFNSTLDLTVGNVFQALSGDDTKFVPEAINYISRHLPAPFYIELAFGRAMDSLSAAVDQRTVEKIRRHERRLMKEMGQEYWWAPGEPLPERAPQFDFVR